MPLTGATARLLEQLHRRGPPFTLADLAKIGHWTPGSAKVAAHRLMGAGHLVALPIRGTYAFPGWEDRPWAEWMVFQAWLRRHPERGWVDPREALYLPEPPPWGLGRPHVPRPRPAEAGPWRVHVISDHREVTLARVYAVRRVTQRAPRLAIVPGPGVPIAW